MKPEIHMSEWLEAIREANQREIKFPQHRTVGELCKELGKARSTILAAIRRLTEGGRVDVQRDWRMRAQGYPYPCKVYRLKKTVDKK